MGRVERRVAYDDPCHLLHGQKIGSAPRQLLEQIPGLQLVPLPGAEQCCGSAGIYNITHYEMSMRLLEKKIQNIKESKAQIVATGNPGCMMQIAYGARKLGVRVKVVHPIELLDRAYQAKKDEG
jgi:glycolate oxidase iron-sulfur subunit